MKIFLTIAASTAGIYLLMLIDLLIAGILSFGIVIGILIRILVLLNELHKELVLKEEKTMLDRYLEERDRKENAIHFKG